MDPMKQEKIALFRFGIIFPLLDERLNWGERTRIIEEICEQSHQIPFSDRRSISKATVYNWLRRYNRKQRIEDLYPTARQDRGYHRKLSSETQAALHHFRDQHPDVKLTTLVEMAIAQGIFLPEEQVGMSVIYRMFKDYDQHAKAKKTKDMRRFSMENCNDCWMLDAMSGPKVCVESAGKKRMVHAKLWALIDDKSRLITYAQFYPDEKAESLIDCMIKAFSSRGLPRKIFTDNGSAMRDHRLKLALASLQIQLSYAKPYSPTSKAKIERFFSTVRMQFLPTLGDQHQSLYELNKAWLPYMQQYNTRFHSGIQASPLEVYLKEIQAVRPAPPDMQPLFRSHERRKVSLARTVSLHGRLYEMPIGYAGLTVDLRFTDEHHVEAFYEGNSLGFLRECDQIANSRALRRTPNSSLPGGSHE
jgi:transposase InsO family protein